MLCVVHAYFERGLFNVIISLSNDRRTVDALKCGFGKEWKGSVG